MEGSELREIMVLILFQQNQKKASPNLPTLRLPMTTRVV
jgi:hypothetical protein